MNLLECWQAASVAFDTWICGGTKGRAKTEPVYQICVEGRDIPPNYEKYSSCADRAHMKMFRFGGRRDFINREERTPLPSDFEFGVNISDLHNLAKGSPCMFAINTRGQRFAVAPGESWVPSVGDEMITWIHPLGRDAHSLAIVTFDGKLAVTANYGSSGMSAAVFPGSKLSKPTPLEFRNGKWWYGNPAKPVMRVLRLVDYIETFTEIPNFDGIPFDDRFTGEVSDRLRNRVIEP